MRSCILLVQKTRRGIPCSLENDMPSSKSSSQLSVCSSGWRKTAGKGSASGPAFFAGAGGATFLAADKAGNRLSEEERAAGEEDSLCRGLTGDASNSCCRAASNWSRPPCFEGREGAVHETRCVCIFEGHAPKKHTRLTPERLVPLLYLEHGLVKVIVAQRTRTLDHSFRTLPVSHLLFGGEHPWMT